MLRGEVTNNLISILLARFWEDTRVFFWYEIHFLMLQICVWEMYLVGGFISGWMKRQRRKIVSVGITIVNVLLNGGGGE